jgi:hypothetical protein
MRPPDLLGRHTSRTRDRLDHHAFQRALVQLAGQQPGQESALGGGGPAEQVGQQPPAARLGAGPSYRADLREHRIGLGHGQRRHSEPGGGRLVQQIPQRRVADPDLPLQQFAGQEGDHDRDLRRAGGAQQFGDLVDLDAPPGGGRHRLRGECELC